MECRRHRDAVAVARLSLLPYPRDQRPARPEREPGPPASRNECAMTETTIDYPNLERPERFTQAELGWVPWLQPLREDELTERHWTGLVDVSRAKSPYFMLLARDPEI